MFAGSSHGAEPAYSDAAEALAATLAGFVTLPGGLGTLDELIEAVTWNQLGIHAKPVGLLDAGGYWEPLAALVDHAAAEGFVSYGEPEVLIRAAAQLQRPGRVRISTCIAHSSPSRSPWPSYWRCPVPPRPRRRSCRPSRTIASCSAALGATPPW